MADVEVSSEESVPNSNEVSSAESTTMKMNEASSEGSEDQRRRVNVSRVKDGWNGVWTTYPIGSIYPNTHQTFADLQSAVMEIVNTNWNEQPPHNPELGAPADTYQIPSEGQEYVISYLAHPHNGGGTHHVPRLRKIDVSVLGWARFHDLLTEVHFCAPESARPFAKYDADETDTGSSSG